MTRPRPSFLRRFVRITLLSALAGVTLTYLTAWTFVLLSEKRSALAAPVWIAPREYLSSRNWLWMFDHAGGRGIDRWESACIVIDNPADYEPRRTPPATVPTFITSGVDRREREIVARMTAAGFAPEHIARNVEGDVYHDERAGWPRLALRHEVRTAPSFAGQVIKEVRWGIELRRTSSKDPLGIPQHIRRLPLKRLAALPLRPVWPGFGVNVAVYTAAAWLVIFAPGVLRRTRRRIRGRCLNCGYDRRGLPTPDAPCPECASPTTTTSPNRKRGSHPTPTPTPPSPAPPQQSPA